jgi:hypothetical protein
MQIFVKFCYEKTKVIDVCEDDTVHDVLTKFFFPKMWNRLYFLFNGKILSFEERIKDKLEHGSTIYACFSNVERFSNVENIQ